MAVSLIVVQIIIPRLHCPLFAHHHTTLLFTKHKDSNEIVGSKTEKSEAEASLSSSFRQAKDELAMNPPLHGGWKWKDRQEDGLDPQQHGAMSAGRPPRNLQTYMWKWTQLGSDIDGEAPGDEFGTSVAFSGDGTVLAVGAPNNDGNGANSGHVRVYKYDANNARTQLGADIDGEATGDGFGYAVALSSDGSVLAVGAPYNKGTCPGCNPAGGHVRVYNYGANNMWTQLGSDIDSTGWSGWSVSLSDDGSILALGAHYGNSSWYGLAQVYKYGANNVWAQLGATIYGEAATDRSGMSVSLSSDGSVLAIGAPYGGSGYARVYKYTSNAWTQIGSNLVGEVTGDQFGLSVSLSSDGSVLAVGAPYNDVSTGNTNDNRGRVRVYQYVTNTWIQRGNIDGDIGWGLTGWSVSLSSDGNRLAIGGAGTYQHLYVQVYQFADGTWTQIGCNMNAEGGKDNFGRSVSLSGDGTKLAVGGAGNDVGGANTVNIGHARVYQVGLNDGSCTAPPTSTPTTGKPTSQPSFRPTTASPSTLLPSQTPTTQSPTTQPSTSSPTLLPTTQSPTTQPSFQPTTVSPSTPLPSQTPTTQSPTTQPSVQPTSAPPSTILLPTQSPSTTIPQTPQSLLLVHTTLKPTKSPVFVTLPFIGRCPPQLNDAVALTYYYEPGDRVSKDSIVYECTSWPNSLFCSQAAFTPNLADSSKSTYWKQAWEVVGHCNDTSSPPEDGCPDEWTSGDTYTKYKENDQVSVIKSNTPLIQAVYKCKAWPYSWHCGQHSPLDYNGGKLGWEYVGTCTGTLGPTSSPTLDPGTAVITGCPAEYRYSSSTPLNYIAGDQVSITTDTSSSYKLVYQCREFPFSGYCNQREVFAPGEQYDYLAWSFVGPCDGTLAPTNAPTAYSGGAPCTYIKVDTTTSPMSTPAVTPVSAWSASTLYNTGDQVRIGAKKFQCKPWPYYFWCRVSVYAPTLSETGLWTEAWSLAGTCPLQ